MILQNYLLKHKYYDPFISEPIHKNTNLIVVIPSFNEDKLIDSLESIYNCNKPKCVCEVIVVINCSENSSSEILDKTEKTYTLTKNWCEKHSTENLKFHVIYVPNLPTKDAGVGLARKIGMDEAVHRFNRINNNNGIIASFDADCICEPNYLIELEKVFLANPQTNVCVIYFEHPVQGNDFTPAIYNAITQYELHLRYYVQALRYIKFPYSYHTIGSCFAVKVSTYAMQGGMNKRKAGEDFYFLQKIITLKNVYELNTTTIIPSPRPSMRVPFGTGAAIIKYINSNNAVYYTYNLDSFLSLIPFFNNIKMLYEEKYNNILPQINDCLQQFLKNNNVINSLNEIKHNSASLTAFTNRFYRWFNAFMVLKYLNYAHQHKFIKLPVLDEALRLINYYYKIPPSISAQELLLKYRDMQKNMVI